MGLLTEQLLGSIARCAGTKHRSRLNMKALTSVNPWHLYAARDHPHLPY